MNNASSGCIWSNSIERSLSDQQCFYFRFMLRSFDGRFMLHVYFTSLLLLLLSWASFYIPIVYHAQRMLACQLPIVILITLQLLPGSEYWTTTSFSGKTSKFLNVLTASHIWNLSCFLFMVLSQLVYFVSIRCITHIHQAVREIDTAYSQYVMEAQSPALPIGTRGPVDARSAVANEAAAYKRLRKRISRLLRNKTHESVDFLLPRIQSPSKELTDIFRKSKHPPPHDASKPAILPLTTKTAELHLPLSLPPSSSESVTPTLPLAAISNQISSSISSFNAPTTTAAIARPKSIDSIQSSIVNVMGATLSPSKFDKLSPLIHPPPPTAMKDAVINSNRPPNRFGRVDTSNRFTRSAKASLHAPFHSPHHHHDSKAMRVSTEDLQIGSSDPSAPIGSTISLSHLSFLNSLESPGRQSLSRRHVKFISRFIPRTKLSLIFLVSYVPSDVTARRALPVAFLIFLYFYVILYFF